jgi:hypothetical protein
MMDEQPSAAELQQAVIGSLMAVIAAPDDAGVAGRAHDALSTLENWLSVADSPPCG